MRIVDMLVHYDSLRALYIVQGFDNFGCTLKYCCQNGWPSPQERLDSHEAEMQALRKELAV